MRFWCVSCRLIVMRLAAMHRGRGKLAIGECPSCYDRAPAPDPKTRRRDLIRRLIWQERHAKLTPRCEECDAPVNSPLDFIFWPSIQANPDGDGIQHHVHVRCQDAWLDGREAKNIGAA